MASPALESPVPCREAQTHCSTRGSTLLLVILFVPSPCGAQRAPVQHLVEEVRIGGAEAGPGSFGRISALSVDLRGNAWVYDGFDHAIREYSPAGQYLRSIGREGSGPGEFKTVAGMAWGPGSRLWVIDGGNGRYSVFDTIGTLVIDYARPVQTYDVPWIGGMDSSGRLFDQARLSTSENPLAQALLAVLEGDVVATVRLPDHPAQGGQRGPISFPLPFSRAFVGAFDPAGFVWYGVSDQYQITRRSLTDTTALLLTGPDKARALSTAERDSVNRYLAALRSQFQVVFKETDRPAAHPLFDAFSVCYKRGELWVHRADHERGTRFDVFDISGVLRYRVDSPLVLAAAPAPVCHDDDLWAVVPGEFDIPYLIRFRLP
jgi:hypothetical protein